MTIFKPEGVPTEAPSGEIAYWAWITPEKAKWVLDNLNTQNRTQKGKGKLDGVSRDIKNNKFRVNGETIKFTAGPRLDDGQHRLESVALSETKIFTLVVENLGPDAQETVDTGSKRTVGDQLGLKGRTNGHAKAAIGKNVLIYNNLGRIADTGSNGYFPSDTEIREFVEDNDDELSYSQKLVYSGWYQADLKLFVPAVVGAVHYIVSRDLPQEADLFFIDQVIKGVNIPFANSPARAFKLFNQSNRGKLKALEQYAYLVKAWNAYRKGTPMRVLKAANDGWNKDNVPSLNLKP